ncbi:unnamed protein product [Closterium sp. Naga37s-1]|nr:unnamed protein product [Closterium sp. Naga37s-1]
MIQTVEDVFPREGDGWNLIKVHLLTHVPESIRRGGLPQEFSSAVYENAYIRTCKLPYITSNHRQPLQAIAAYNVRASAMAQLTSALPARRHNQTALTRAHTAVALPAFPTDYGYIRPHYARAATSLHGDTAFSCVEYLSSARHTVYGRLILLLDAERPLDSSNYEPAEVAVLQRLTQQGCDECTGCQVLGPPGLFRGLVVVPIDRLKRAVHCVPSFEEKDVWFLNKWAYLVNQELN